MSTHMPQPKPQPPRSRVFLGSVAASSVDLRHVFGCPFFGVIGVLWIDV